MVSADHRKELVMTKLVNSATIGSARFSESISRNIVKGNQLSLATGVRGRIMQALMIGAGVFAGGVATVSGAQAQTLVGRGTSATVQPPRDGVVRGGFSGFGNRNIDGGYGGYGDPANPRGRVIQLPPRFPARAPVRVIPPSAWRY